METGSECSRTRQHTAAAQRMETGGNVAVYEYSLIHDVSFFSFLWSECKTDSHLAVRLTLTNTLKTRRYILSLSIYVCGLALLPV